MNNTKTNRDRWTLDDYLVNAGIDPFEVPADLAEDYANVTDAEADTEMLRTLAGRNDYSAIYDIGDRQAKRLILQAVSDASGYDIGSRYSLDLLFSETERGGTVKDDEAAMRAVTLRLLRSTRGDYALRLARHGGRIKLATVQAGYRAAVQAVQDHEERISTDPLTWRSGLRVYGETNLRSVVPDAYVDGFGDGAWSIKATPLVRFLIGHEVARQLLERDPELSKIVRTNAAALIDGNQL